MDWIITSYSPEGYDLYGHRFVTSFDHYWPAEVGLLTYDEQGGKSFKMETTRGRYLVARDLYEVPEMQDFISRHARSDHIKGLKPYRGQLPWKPKCVREGYNFRYDAWKFCRKILAIKDATDRWDELNIDRLVWIDADVVVRAAPPRDFIDNVIPGDVGVSYLGRQEDYHSECGFVAYDLTIPAVREFIQRFSEIYSQDKFIDLREWHDSWVFDWLRHGTSGVVFRNLSAGQHGAVFDKTFGPWMTHNKGDLKTQGRRR